ncbi:copper homeostasis protein CutC [Alkaliphilus peptidifermentans]|uniref:PF03932 family protein CutC n=1 Tax=Alkaliphilus peptidifermentans DSM 18978 TaxID=1120976 RepID=A0A1G5IRI7_9FIRM|nr:copper homeostasis protein CutC [Alkaliphilus peptidifermentans]SCY78692.1 copper homeostasis protein [Alkaliphilus peptidifermentans DSM 18978]
MILEVCVDSYESLLIAKEAGANRIELCSALNLGGLTPSYGLMKQASTQRDIEIFVMIRPRSGDFLYDDLEFETMKNDIVLAKEMGFDGVVTGMLLRNGRIDLKRLEEVVTIANPLKVVFHRAFDEAKEPEGDIPRLIEMGVCRILTSGQQENALLGVEYIREIQVQYGDQITIMPGAGVNSSNVTTIYEKTGCTHYHLSGKVDVGSAMVYRKNTEKSCIKICQASVEKADHTRIAQVRSVLNNLYG